MVKNKWKTLLLSICWLLIPLYNEIRCMEEYEAYRLAENKINMSQIIEINSLVQDEVDIEKNKEHVNKASVIFDGFVQNDKDVVFRQSGGVETIGAILNSIKTFGISLIEAINGARGD